MSDYQIGERYPLSRIRAVRDRASVSTENVELRGTRLAGAAVIALLAIELIAMGRNSIPERLRSDTPFTEATSVPTTSPSH